MSSLTLVQRFHNATEKLQLIGYNACKTKCSTFAVEFSSSNLLPDLLEPMEMNASFYGALQVSFLISTLLSSSVSFSCDSLMLLTGTAIVRLKVPIVLIPSLCICFDLQIVISHLTELCSVSVADQAGPLIDVILKLFSYAINLKVNRQALISHAGDWKTFLTFITLLKNTVKSRPSLSHQLVAIMETAFKEASTTLSVDSYKEFVAHCGGQQDIMDLLEILDTLEGDSKAAEQLLRIVPFLCFCNELKMLIVVEHFSDCLEFAHFDLEPSVSDSKNLEWLCRLIEMLGEDEVSATMKDLWLRDGMTKRVIDYFLLHASIITTGSPESAEFKRNVGKNSMK